MRWHPYILCFRAPPPYLLSCAPLLPSTPLACPIPTSFPRFRQQKLLIVNSGMLFRTVWAVVQPFLDARTSKKVRRREAGREGREQRLGNSS